MEAEYEGHDDRGRQKAGGDETDVVVSEIGHGRRGFHLATRHEDETQSHVNKLFEILSQIGKITGLDLRK